MVSNMANNFLLTNLKNQVAVFAKDIIFSSAIEIVYLYQTYLIIIFYDISKILHLYIFAYTKSEIYLLVSGVIPLTIYSKAIKK